MDFHDRIGLERPVVQAGMGGELAGAVSAAGGLGTVGMMAPRALAAALGQAHRKAPGRLVAANLLVPFIKGAHLAACLEANAALVVLHGGFAPRGSAPARRRSGTVGHAAVWLWLAAAPPTDPQRRHQRWCRGDPLGGALPLGMLGTMLSLQRPALPLFTPALPLAGMPDRTVDAGALYAGKTIHCLHDVIPAAEALARLTPWPQGRLRSASRRQVEVDDRRVRVPAREQRVMAS